MLAGVVDELMEVNRIVDVGEIVVEEVPASRCSKPSRSAFRKAP